LPSLSKIYAIVLIAFGTFLEFWYYVARFEGDGIHIVLSCIIAIALNVFLGAAVLRRKTLAGRIIMVVVILYSIINTNAGQELSLSMKQQSAVVAESKEANVQDEILRISRRLVAIETENAQILNERRLNLIGSSETSRRQHDLKVEREAKEVELSKLREKATTNVQTTKHTEEARDGVNTYGFYEKLLGVSQSVLRFWFHFALSVFIAMMAPFGLALFGKGEKATKLPNGFIGWYTKASTDYSKRTGKQIPAEMLRLHAKNAGWSKQELEEVEAIMPVQDISLGEAELAARINKLLKKKQKEVLKANG
jgi:hypothetical protein